MLGVLRQSTVNRSKLERRMLSGDSSIPSKSTATTSAGSASNKPVSKVLAPDQELFRRTSTRGPVSWASLFLTGVAAASAVAYYQIERERRLEEAMGKVVSSESDGWTPKPEFLAKRKFVATKWGWFPQEDGFGARELGSPIAYCVMDVPL